MEEQENWVPDCMFEEEGVKMNHGLEKVAGQSVGDGQDGEDYSSEEEDGFSIRSDNDRDDNSGKMLPELLTSVKDHEQSEAFNVGGILGFVNLENTRGNDSVHIPKKGGESKNSGRDHWASRNDNGLASNSNNFNLGRPIKTSRRSRPRNKKSTCCANVSPISDPRPRKRPREDSEFSFDLNKHAVDSLLSSPSRCINEEVRTNPVQEVVADPVSHAALGIFSQNQEAVNPRMVDREDLLDVEGHD
ncbi:hypothetical protein Hanom_Chr12g01178871 [Helianthus anomalus]